MDVQFVVTPWRNAKELLELRGQLYGQDWDGRQRAVNKVLAWRIRKQDLPLLLESTADIVEAVLQDEKGELTHNALRLVYATSISRFITGLSDTKTDLARNRPSFFTHSKALQFPYSLRETRHSIVHRHLPSLAELKRAATEALKWLWEWYWSHLDAAFAVQPRQQDGSLTQREIRERSQAVLKSYVKERKGEIKSRKKELKAAGSAASSFFFIDADIKTKQNVLLELLVDDKAILPADKKMGSSMSGAFLIWTPFLHALCKPMPSFLSTLVERMFVALSYTSSRESDPVQEGVYEWLLHILTSSDWQEARCSSSSTSSSSSKSQRIAQKRFLDHALGLCFTAPTFWTLKLAEALLKDEELPGREAWLQILEVAKSEDVMEVDSLGGTERKAIEGPRQDVHAEAIEMTLPVSRMEANENVEKLRGPQKKVGLWRPQPIGMIPKGWEVDE